MKVRQLTFILVFIAAMGHPPQASAALFVRQTRAISKNNAGIAAQEKGDFEKAIRLLQEAHELDPENASIRGNLSNILTDSGYGFLVVGELDKAEERLRASLEVSPNEPNALEALGMVFYQRHQLDKARTFWQMSLEIEPDNPKLVERLKDLSREKEIDGSFRQVQAPHFDIRTTEGAINKKDYALRKLLRDVYRTVSQDMQFFTARTIIVLIYTDEAYLKLRKTPHWSAGLFDGKIRIPIHSGSDGWTGLEATLRHEFTHALIWERTRANCPPWLNEGLAQYEERGGRFSKMPRKSLKLLSNKKTQSITLEALSSPFIQWNDIELIRRGYAKSESLVRYIIHRYSLAKIHRMLDALGKGQTIRQVLRTELATSPEGLDLNWTRAVKRGKVQF